MDIQTFRTHVKPSPVVPFVEPESTVFSIGSCFAENVGQKLYGSCFSCTTNPFGVVYNPASIARLLVRCQCKDMFSEKDLASDGERWFSYEAHGMFKRPSAEECCNALNAAVTTASEALPRADVLLLTFGTSYIYRLRETREVAANCHKQPSNRFSRELLDHGAALEHLYPSLETLLAGRPQLNIVLTVSPVRHLRDDPHENQVSKSHLLLLSEALCQLSPRIHYFPAYEIMMDDLRDYRFYTEDMIHPSPVAVDYIWSLFRKWCFSERSNALADRVEEICQRQSHRPRDPQSDAHKQFVSQTHDMITQLANDFPEADLDNIFGEQR